MREHLVMFLIAGAALAAPALVLEVRSAGREIVLPMRGVTFTYSYRQSIYDVGVREHLLVDDGRLHIERAASTDLRALEYFRWPGAARAAGDALEWDAPAQAGLARLDIAVVRRGEQAVDTGVRRLSLEAAFGDTSVTVAPAWRPLAAWLWSALAWP